MAHGVLYRRDMKRRRKLSLNRSTLRNLAASDLGRAEGGVGMQTFFRCTSQNSSEDYNNGQPCTGSDGGNVCA